MRFYWVEIHTVLECTYFIRVSPLVYIVMGVSEDAYLDLSRVYSPSILNSFISIFYIIVDSIKKNILV